jgi:hypothetical protein
LFIDSTKNAPSGEAVIVARGQNYARHLPFTVIFGKRAQGVFLPKNMYSALSFNKNDSTDCLDE